MLVQLSQDSISGVLILIGPLRHKKHRFINQKKRKKTCVMQPYYAQREMKKRVGYLL